MANRIVEGPFKDFPARVIGTDPETGEVTVVVDVFGRETQLQVPPSALGGGDDAGDREPRQPRPTDGDVAAAVDPDA